MTDTHHHKIKEHPVEGKRLGRHVLHDPRSKNFPAEGVTKLVSVTHQATGLPLDQGQLGSCTANALCGALNSSPDYEGGQVFTEPDAIKVYEEETALEGEPYPPNDPGGTGLMVCRAAKRMGFVRYYRHAFGLEHALQALVPRPVIIGIDWYDSFDEPPSSGIIEKPSGAQIRGGHEVVLDELDVDRQLVGAWNSWGPGWGLGGRFYIPWQLLDFLLSSDGDCTVPYPASKPGVAL